MHPLYLRLLGTPEVKAGTARFSFAPERRYQLLAYLAYQREWVSRDKLAYLFWPDHSDEAARRNLRKALFTARQLTWLELERQRLHGLFRTAVFSHADTLAKQGRHEEAVKPLQRFLEHDALVVEAVQKLLLRLSELGETTKGAEIYQGFVTTLEHELGLEPSTETRQLFERLEQPRRPATLEVQTSPSFIGRTLELQELSDLLAQPDCRLLTVLGPGGVGKTRVALHLAKKLTEKFEDGVYVILLDALNAPEFIVPKIIEVLGLTSQGVKEPLEYLKHYLSKKHVLLLLDNFEHLVSRATLLSRLLGECPPLKLLVTSRERLNLVEGWLLPLEGLRYPKEANVTLGQALTYEAVQLFVGRAKRLQPHFTLTQADVTYLVDICRLVDGFPLGLELAATWVRHLSLSEIAKEIQGNTDFLHSSSRDVALRQQSVRATFEHSWNLLNSREQKTLARLSVFHSGFHKEAAAFVTGASLPILTSLVDKSLLRIRTGRSDVGHHDIGRYDFHELIRQYTGEKLQGHERETTLERHATFYAEFVAAREKDAHGGAREVQILDDLETELSNIRLAWKYTTKRGMKGVFDKMIETLTIFYVRRDHIREGEESTRLAAESLKAKRLEESVTRGRLLSRQSFFSHYLIGAKEALPIAEKSLALLESCRAKPDLIAWTLWNLSVIQQRLGQLSNAERYARKSLEYNRRGKNPFQAARALLALSYALRKHDARGAEGYLREAITYFREADDKWGLGLALQDLGELLSKQKRLAEAKAAQEESLRVYEFFGKSLHLAKTLTEYGMTLCAEGNYGAALKLHERSLAIHRDYHTPETFYPLEHLGETNLALGEVGKALEYFLEAFSLALSFDDDHTLAILVGMAEALAQLHDVEKAALLGCFALTRAESELSERANLLLEQLESELPATDLHAIQKRVASWQWADVKC